MVRTLRLNLTAAAQAALTGRDAPLLVELELLFSCLLRKRVHFPHSAPEDALPMESGDAQVKVHFRPVMTHHCVVGDVEVEPELERFPIQKPEAFMPHWLTLDHRNGHWHGEFGYQRDALS